MKEEFNEGERNEKEKASDVPGYFYLGIRPHPIHHTPEAHFLRNTDKTPVALLQKLREDFAKGHSVTGSINWFRIAYAGYDDHLDNLHDLEKCHKAALSTGAVAEKSSVAQYALGLTELKVALKKFHGARHKQQHETRGKEFLNSRNPQNPTNSRSWKPKDWGK